MNGFDRAVALAVVVTAVAVPFSLRGEETIRDPERPTISEDESGGPSSDTDPDGSDDREERDEKPSSEAEESRPEGEGGGETIVDPENPLVSDPSGEGADAGGESTEAAQENDDPDGGGRDERDGSADGAPTASFRAGYATSLWVDTRWTGRREDIVEWRNGASLTLESTLSPRWSARISAEFYHWMGGKQNPGETDLLVNAARPRATAEFRLGEAYALYESDHYAVRVGNLVTSWGSTDLVRPGDVINPIDATEFAGRGPGRLAQPAAEVSYLQPNWSLTGVVVPFFAQHRIAVFGRDSALATGRRPLLGSSAPLIRRFQRLLDRSQFEEVQPLVLAPSVPDERPVNASLGLRWTGTRWNTDFGFGYFWGWDRTPSLEVDPQVREFTRIALDDPTFLRTLDVPAFLERNPEAAELGNDIARRAQRGERLLDSRYKRRHTLLFDVARYVGPIGLRADVAFQPERTFLSETLQTVRRPTVFAALGTSYERLTGGRPFAITVEGFWFEPFDAGAAPTRWFVSDSEAGRDGAPLVMFDDPYRGVAGAFDWTMPWAGLELRLAGLFEIDRGGVVADGSIGRQWAPWLRTSVGARLYEGPEPASELSLGGLYDPNDQIGVTVQGRF